MTDQVSMDEPSSPDGRGPESASAAAGPSEQTVAYRSRTERRVSRRAKRRRKVATRFGLAAGSAVVVIAVVVALFVLLTGSESGGGGGAAPPTDEVQGSESGDVLLVLRQEDAEPLLVLLHPRNGGGAALAMPGLTLLKTTEGFRTLSEIYSSSGGKGLQTALAKALGVKVAHVASGEWSTFRTAMEDAGVGELPPPVLGSDESGCEQVARAVIAFAGTAVSEEGKRLWGDLRLQGDPGGFRKAVDELAPALSGDGWSAAALSGRLVEGSGFTYIEPDVEAAKVVLAGVVVQVEVVLQVQNGSGVLGVAQETSELLSTLGYTMMPVGNSKDFPNVEFTRIEVASDAATQAAKVRFLLGTGMIDVDPGLEPGHIVVVLGKDFIPPQTTVPTTAG